MKEEAVTVNGLKLIFISKIREMSLQRFSVCGERNTYTDSCGSSFLFFSLHEQIQEYFCLSIVAPVGKVALIFIIKMEKKKGKIIADLLLNIPYSCRLTSDPHQVHSSALGQS